jgi:hypothetical protein
MPCFKNAAKAIESTVLFLTLIDPRIGPFKPEFPY